MTQKIIPFLLMASLLPVLGSAEPSPSTDISFDASLGWRQDQFQWNIAGYDGIPNILSELTWTDIRVWEGRLSGRARWMNAAALTVEWAGGRIVDGRNQDSDYLGDGRSYEYSRTNNTADMGNTHELRLGAGYPFGDPSDTVLTPALGWVLSSERLFMTKMKQTVSEDYGVPGLVGQIPPVGSYSGLNSHYRHEWRGLWLGVESETVMAPRLVAVAALRYYPGLDYSAEADWNLRYELEHPVSFTHEATGKGWDFSIGFLHALDETMEVGAGLDWRRWRADGGTDRTHLYDGTRESTRLNEVTWNTLSLRVAFRFRPFAEENDPPPFEWNDGGPSFP